MRAADVIGPVTLALIIGAIIWTVFNRAYGG